ncbi:MAG: hypothetical protein GWP07_05645 [Xanthomonadaceae bacterium]|nr:hypothetical protein [Xanthomonadaceae bacterium]
MFKLVTDIALWMKAHESLCWWLTIASALTFIGTLIVLPLLLIRIPADYFTRQHSCPSDRHPVAYWSMVISKNILGILLLLAGIAMLFLPGQGIITILLAVTLLNFPGKRKLEQRFIGLPGVLTTINRIRRRSNRPPLLDPHQEKNGADQ